MNMTEHSRDVFLSAREAATHLQALLPQHLKTPSVGIICGSGLGGLADALHGEPRFEAIYSDIPYFPQATGTNSRCMTRHSRCFMGASKGLMNSHLCLQSQVTQENFFSAS